MKLYERIRKLREDAGYTQEQLAVKLDVSRQSVFKWENGTSSPEMEQLQEICTVFGVSIAEILGANTKPSEMEQIQLYEEKIKKQKNQKQFKKLLIFGTATSALILLVMFVMLFHRIGILNNHLKQLDGQVNQIYFNVNQRMVEMNSQFSSMLEQQESLVAEYSIDAKDLIVRDGQLILTVRATPKNYREGITAEFVMNGKKNYVACAVLENGSFWADVPVDINENDLRIMVRFTSDGETTTQYLDNHPNLLSGYLMKVWAENDLRFLNDKDGLLIQGEVITIYSPRYDYLHDFRNMPKLINYPVSGEVVVSKNGKVVIRNEIDLDLDINDGEYSECQIYTTINETIKDYKPGDEIRVFSIMIDNFGNVRETEGCIYI